MYHFQTFVLGIFPFRLHAYKGRDVTHLMDDPIVGDDESAAAARTAGLPYPAGRHRRARRQWAPDHARRSTRRRVGTTRERMLDSERRDRMAAFTMQGEDLPQATNRIDLDPAVHDVWGLPAGRVTYQSHAHEIACAEHWAPRLEAVMREAGADATFWVTSPGIPGEHRRRGCNRSRDT